MTNEKTLPQSKKHLTDAIHKLTAPQHRIINNTLRTAPSRYHQLAQALAGTQGQAHAPAKSMPPLWIDATQLLTDIDTQTHHWVVMPGTTPWRLNTLADKGWRPQDVDHVNTITAAVQRWCDSIDALLDPEHVKHITAACPSCGKKTMYRKDSAGETVRQPALRIVTNTGCECQACGAFWAPDRYLFLCRLLGFDMPTGVLE